MCCQGGAGLKKLKHGVMLELAHPEVSARSCDACKRWIFDTENGRLVKNRLTGDPIERPAGTRTPCATCPKCSGESNPSPDIGHLSDLSPRNRTTLKRYWEYRVVPGPTDDIIQRNFGVIYELLNSYDRGIAKAALITIREVRR